ncbi:MAG TPA: hypothetical protein P5513_03775, partial [Candidatus Diapherotrites archaeon]|nr:hypothetical protein [Candidatus Diapherotrites archaeon]
QTASKQQEKETLVQSTIDPIIDIKTFLNQNNGKVVIINGKEGTLTIINENRIEIKNENTIYEFTIEDVESYSEKENASLNSKYIITNISETTVTVNNIEYIINTDNKGNVISLTPKNNYNQKIKNINLIIAVEIERNKLEIKTQPVLENITVSESLIENNYGDLDLLLNTIYNINYTDVIDSALEKLYDGKKLDNNEKLQLGLWLQDCFDRLSKLFNSQNTEIENEILLNAYDNLEIILSLLYDKNLKETTKNYKNEKKNNVGKTEVTNTSKKNKRRINNKIQEKETPLTTDLFPTQSTEELNITYARKKAEQIIEELPEDLLSSIENIEDAKLYLQNIILERLVKYTGKDIGNITDKRSTKAIDKIVNEIKQEFFNLMEQERTIVEVESVPDSDIINVDVLSIEGIIEQVHQNTAILVESTEKILANSKKNSNFVATEETILNVLKEIKNFKC